MPDSDNDSMSGIMSPYRRGADKGLYLGIWLAAMFFAMVYSIDVPLLGLLSIGMFLGVPVIVYRWLRRTFVEEHGLTTLSSLWMQGIMIFACGSLINALVATVYLKWVRPDFITDRLKDAIEFYSGFNDPSAQQAAELMQRIIDSHMVPSAVSVAMETVWLAIFTGSLLSLILALIARARKPYADLNKM